MKPFLLRHGYVLLFVFVWAEQMGLPIPAMPALLAMGALAGRFSLPVSLAVATGASLVSDLIWYELGRRRGHSVLNLLCRISLEPDSCVRRTERVFSAAGAYALLVSKFVPGLSTVAPPLAGILQMQRWRFVLCAGLGAALWAGTFLGVGYLFHHELERVAAPLARLGGRLVVLLAAALAAYIGFKYIQRERFLRRLRVARITPDELMRMINSGEDVLVIDLRHPVDFQAVGEKLPGAIHLPPEQLDHRHHEIPRDRDVVLYCT